MRYNLRSTTTKRAPEQVLSTPTSTVRVCESVADGAVPQRRGIRRDSLLPGKPVLPESPSRQLRDYALQSAYTPLPERQSGFPNASALVDSSGKVRVHPERPGTERSCLTSEPHVEGPRDQLATLQGSNPDILSPLEVHVQEMNSANNENVVMPPKLIPHVGGVSRTQERGGETMSPSASHSLQLTKAVKANGRPATEVIAENARKMPPTESTAGSSGLCFRGSRRLRPRLLLPSPASTPSLTQSRKKRRILFHSELSGLDGELSGTALSNPSVSFVCSSSTRTNSTTSPTSSGPRSYPSSYVVNSGSSTPRVTGPIQRSQIPASVECHGFQEDANRTTDKRGDSQRSSKPVTTTRCSNDPQGEPQEKTDTAAVSPSEPNGSISGLPLHLQPSRCSSGEPCHHVQADQVATRVGCSVSQQATSLRDTRATCFTPCLSTRISGSSEETTCQELISSGVLIPTVQQPRMQEAGDVGPTRSSTVQLMEYLPSLSGVSDTSVDNRRTLTVAELTCAPRNHHVGRCQGRPPLQELTSSSHPTAFIGVESPRNECNLRESLTSSGTAPESPVVVASGNSTDESSTQQGPSVRVAACSCLTLGPNRSPNSAGCSTEGNHSVTTVSARRAAPSVNAAGMHCSSLITEKNDPEGQILEAEPQAAIRPSEGLWEPSGQGSASAPTTSSCVVRKQWLAPIVPPWQGERRRQKRETNSCFPQSIISCRPPQLTSAFSDISNCSSTPYSCSSSLLLRQLPPAILCAVLRFLPCASVLAFGTTCRYAHDLVQLPAAWNLLEDTAVLKLLHRQQASHASGRSAPGKVRPRLRDFKTFISRFTGVTKLAVDLTFNSTPTNVYAFPWHLASHTSGTASVLPSTLLRLLPTRVTSDDTGNGRAGREETQATTGVLIRSTDSSTATNLAAAPVTSGTRLRSDGDAVLLLQGFVGESGVDGRVLPSLGDGHRAGPQLDTAHPSHSNQIPRFTGVAPLPRESVCGSVDSASRTRSTSVSDQDRQCQPEGFETCRVPAVLSTASLSSRPQESDAGRGEQRFPELIAHSSEPQQLVSQTHAPTTVADPRQRRILGSTCHVLRDREATVTRGAALFAWGSTHRRRTPITSTSPFRPATSVPLGEHFQFTTSGAVVSNSQETVEPQRAIDPTQDQTQRMRQGAAYESPGLTHELSQIGGQAGRAGNHRNEGVLDNHESRVESVDRLPADSGPRRHDRSQCEDFPRERTLHERTADSSGESTQSSRLQHASRVPIIILLPSPSRQGASSATQESERRNGDSRDEADELRSALNPARVDAMPNAGLIGQGQEGRTRTECHMERLQHRWHHHRVRMERQQLMLLHQLLVHLRGQQSERSREQARNPSRGQRNESEHPRDQRPDDVGAVHEGMRSPTRPCITHERTYPSSVNESSRSEPVRIHSETRDQNVFPIEHIPGARNRINETRESGTPFASGYLYEEPEPQHRRVSELMRTDGCTQPLSRVQALEEVDTGVDLTHARRSPRHSRTEESPRISTGQIPNDSFLDSVPLYSTADPYQRRAEEAAAQNGTPISQMEVRGPVASRTMAPAAAERSDNVQRLEETASQELGRIQRRDQSRHAGNVEHEVFLVPFLFASATQLPLAFAPQGDQLSVMSPGSGGIGRNPSRRQHRQQAAHLRCRTRRGSHWRSVFSSARERRAQGWRPVNGRGPVSPACLRALFGGLRHLVQLTLKLEAKEAKQLHQLTQQLDLVQGLLQQNAKTLRVFKLSVELPHEKEVRMIYYNRIGYTEVSGPLFLPGHEAGPSRRACMDSVDSHI
ncbi:hypothetical protein TGGT1_359350 [Toxoplasma gondii GT1]|uniref:F-box domain-containing protein n=3 Tax=Toxoplasma gondii TaxID=5811 RepID=S7UMT2_TOXGG|nr:hypothetical protein TGGT1_359350 [Toxoplasma gondii GT1]KAF4645303.1 hypothetical protein TGRH88_004050 [Toxoplasma gondii]KFG53016.1 hypothetical protein TGFOU_359350 [Toxoplasma gondii FOU]